MHNRLIWSQLVEEIETPEVVVITGPRQVGKTTTIRWLLDQIPSENKIYFDLENLIDRELFETKNYESLLNELIKRGLKTEAKLFVALDEIQLLPNLPSVVKYLYDHYQIKFFLTGSSSYYIKNRFSESMAGRKIIYEILPLTFQEFLDFKGVRYELVGQLPLKGHFQNSAYELLKAQYEEFLEFGGLPKVVLTPEISRKRQILEEIFSSFINLDVQTLSDFKSTTDLRRVIKLLASRVGNRINVSELANITGLTRVTIDSYLDFLEATYLIKTVEAMSESADVRLRLPKKLYFIDTGIANVNADLSSGSKFENSIHHQLSSYGKLSFYSDRDGEIDFILENEGKKLALEVKETPTEPDLKTLQRRANTLGISQVRLIGKEPSVKFNDYLWGGFIK